MPCHNARGLDGSDGGTIRSSINLAASMVETLFACHLLEMNTANLSFDHELL